MTSRRMFMKRGALLAAAGSVATLGYGFFNPQPNNSTAVRFPDAECGRGAEPNYLVTYASEFGTTGEVAVEVATTLCESGAHVTTKRIRDVTDLASYDAVVVGAPIQFDNWMSEARNFIESNEATLAARPVAYFFTCLTLAEQSPGADTKALGYARKLADLSSMISPVAIGRFGGVLDYSRMSLPAVLASKVVYTATGVDEGDYRNWDTIEAWTRRSVLL